MKQRFQNDGLEGFADHQVLEFLLFFAFGQKDTNELAHQLIQQFGSLANVFDASFEDLVACNGIGEHAATLIKLIPDLASRYRINRLGSRPFMGTFQDACAYLEPLFLGRNQEEFYMFCLDNRYQLKKAIHLQSGTVDMVAVYPREIVQRALQHHAVYVLLAHNHPSGSPRPSRADVEITAGVQAALAAVHIDLIDHIIVADQGCFSFLTEDTNATDYPDPIDFPRAADIDY